MNYYDSYKWQEKQDKKEPHSRYNNPFDLSAPESIKQIGINKFEMKLNFIYRPNLLSKNFTPVSWYMRSETLRDTDIVIWSEKITWYIKMNNKKKIDWILTPKEYYSKKGMKIELKEIQYIYKGNEIGAISEIVLVDEHVYKLYLREEKLKRIGVY